MNNKKIISIHQPNYLPWLGFFKKISSSDIFVFLDDVQYEKNGWHNRNKIRTDKEWMWLTIPSNVKFGMKLNEVKIDFTSNWQKKHLKSIEINYTKAPHFKKYWEEIKEIYNSNYEFLVEFNLKIIDFLMKKLEINTKITLSSKLNVKESSSDRILNICKKFDADVYISGSLGRNYLQLENFKKNNIEVKFQNFKHPIYEQVYNPFIPNMAAIDLLFNKGEKSTKILNESTNF